MKVYAHSAEDARTLKEELEHFTYYAEREGDLVAKTTAPKQIVRTIAVTLGFVIVIEAEEWEE
jgi:hypothetical protein